MKAITPLLNVDDAAKSVAFYCEKLGFKVDDRFEDNGKLMWARLICGSAELMINVSSERVPRGPQLANSFSDIVLYCSVDDVHSLHRELLGKGCSPTAIERQGYGLDEFLLRDPDGYELSFVSPVKK